MTDELEFSLVENAEDFLEASVDHVRTPEPRDWKYAILHLASALELLFKAILEREHWSLLFEDVNKASIASLTSGKLHSVRFDTAIERARKIVGVELKTRDLDYLGRIHALRNGLQHFTVRINIEQAKSIVARGISLFLDLQHRYVDVSANREFEQRINQALLEFEEYVDVRVRALQPELNAACRPAEGFRACTGCLQGTLVTEGYEAKCLYCGASMSFAALAEATDGPGGPCPQCEIGVLGFVLSTNEDGRFVCVSCGFAAEESLNIRCNRCGVEFWCDGQPPYCSTCWSEIVEKG